MKNLLYSTLFMLSALSLSAQNTFTIQRTLQWASAPTIYTLSDGSPFEVWKFAGCTFGDEARSLPVFSERFAISGKSTIEVDVLSVQWESFGKKASSDDSFLSNSLEINRLVEQERTKFFGRVKFIPVRKTGSGYERATSFTLQVRVTPIAVPPATASTRDADGRRYARTQRRY